MRLTAALYIGEEGRKYLDIYNYHRDVHIMLPPKLRKKTEYVEHFSYGRRKKQGGGCVFQFKEEVDPEEYSDKIYIRKIFTIKDGGCQIDFVNEPNKNQFFRKEDLKNTREKYDVQFEIASQNKKVRKELLFFTGTDIEEFCKGEIAENPRGSEIKFVEKIIPVTRINEIEPPRGFILHGGKQEFNRECLCNGNIDYDADCIVNTFPINSNQIKISDGNLIEGLFAYPFGECRICYASRKHRDHVEPGYGNFFRTIYKFDEKKLKEELMGDCCLTTGSEERLEKPVDYLRFGKRTEAFTSIFKDRYVKTLEIMIETGTRGIATTKFLAHDPYVAELLKATNSVVPRSIGEDESELGACEHGCTNEWRLEQWRLDLETGVNSFPYVLFTAHKGPTNEQKKLFKYIKENNLFAQILPRRFYGSKNLIKEITGQEWDFLKGKIGQESFEFVNREKGSYYLAPGGALSPVINKMHPFWLELVGDNKGNIRMCHHDYESNYCGGCFLNGGFKGRFIFPKKKIILKRSKRKKSNSKQMKKPKIIVNEGLQQSLF